jgi:hypothetical protein
MATGPEPRRVLQSVAGFSFGRLSRNSQSVSAADIFPVMRFAPKGKSTKLRSWRVSILRSRAHYLGTVEASDEKAAEAAAVAQFDLSEEQRKRLALPERAR